MSATCGNCKWWDAPKHGNALAGTCRRHPPAYTTARRSIWPGSQSDDWCGEHQPKETRDEAV